jgi:hypothetical protein
MAMLLPVAMFATVLTAQAADAAPPETTEDNATAITIDLRDDSNETPVSTPPEAPEVLVYQAQIADQQRQGGAFNAALSETSLQFGRLLQELGRHDEAIALFRSGAHIARVNGGLYDQSQIELISAEIDSLAAQARWLDVDERQRYLFRVQGKALQDEVRWIDALVAQGLWQEQAYLLALDEPEVAQLRLFRAENLFLTALAKMMGREQEMASILSAPLYHLLRIYYRASAWNQRNNTRSQFIGFSARDVQLSSFNRDIFARGETAAKTLLDLDLLLSQNNPNTHVRGLIRLGDWAWWVNERDAALSYYAQALAVGTKPAIDETADLTEYAEVHRDPIDAPEAGAATLAAQTDPSTDQQAGESATELLPAPQGRDADNVYASQLLAAPRALPDIDGLRTFIDRQEDDSGSWILQFGVSESGKITNLEQLARPEVKQASDFDRRIRSLRRVKFRPRFEAGQPVATTGLLWSFDDASWHTTDEPVQDKQSAVVDPAGEAQ